MNQFVDGSKEKTGGGGAGGDGGELRRKQQRPFVRKINMPASILVPYRLLIFVRAVVIGIYLSWRIKKKNEDAIWLWGMSVICEVWFAFSWLLEQLPKLCPVKRSADFVVLKDRFESPSPLNPLGISDLPGIDVFVAVADPDEEPRMVMANTLLSVLAADYPVEKLACYLSDDAASALTFEAVAEVAAFAAVWVPFCRKHDVEPRAPAGYFGLTKDPYQNKVRRDFVSDRRTVKREYEEFKIRINALPDSIRRRSDARNALEERKAVQRLRELYGDEPPVERPEVPRATWMANGCHWLGSWIRPCPQHSHGDHSAIVQMMLQPSNNVPALGKNEESSSSSIDVAGVDTRLPTLVYVAREKRPGYEDNRKAGAMNALVRASSVISNGPFALDLDYDNYVCNSAAFREGMCYMMDGGGERTCFVQFPQRFEGVDPSDRYAHHNSVSFDVDMRALDGIQGPVYLGSGCLFRRMALYGFDPPTPTPPRGLFGLETSAIADFDEEDQNIVATYIKRFGNSDSLINSISVAEFGSRPLSDHPKATYSRPPGALAAHRGPVAPYNLAEAMSLIACSYEDKTQWGMRVGWIYGSAAKEDVVTGYRMHNRGWRSFYCTPAAGGRDAFRGAAPIDLADGLQRIQRRAAGAVEFFFSRNNAMLVSPGMKSLQRAAYLNLSVYPFTSIFLTVYCFLPALCLFSGQFIVQTVSVTFLAYVLVLTVTLCILTMLEIKWSGVHLVDWWRNEQLWVMGNTSAHIAALFQGMLKALTGIDLLDNGAKKPAAGDDEEFSDLYAVRWTWLMIPPTTIMMVNLVAIAVGVSRTIYSSSPEWSKFLGGLFFSLWVLMHLYPFAKGMMGKRGKTPTVVFVWSGLIAITISLLWAVIKSPSGDKDIGGSFSFP